MEAPCDGRTPYGSKGLESEFMSTGRKKGEEQGTKVTGARRGAKRPGKEEGQV